MKKIRYGIIGFGDFAERKIMPAIRKSRNSELVAIQKRSAEAAKEKAIIHNIPLFFDSVEALCHSPEIDAVFIVSANAAHYSETLLAARAGKHVLVEKPMAITYQEGVEMVEACQRANVKFMVGHMSRFSPLIQRMKEIVSSGDIGDITYARSEFVFDGRKSQRNWLLNKKAAGGGPLYDIGIHCIDTMRCILNDDEVVSVQSMHRSSNVAEETERTNLLSLRFKKGAVGSIYTSYEPPYYRSFIEVIGTEGSVAAYNFIPSNVIVTLEYRSTKNNTIETIHEENIVIPDLYEVEVTHFSDCILNNEEPLVNSDSSLHNQRILETALHNANEN